MRPLKIENYPEILNAYLDALVPPRPPELQQMEKMASETGFPIIGAASGHFCYQIARITGARRIFEMGSGFGYSTAWFARAVKENGGGEVFHVVWDNDLSEQARHHLAALELGDYVRYKVGEAVQALQETEGPFDIIFNDIDKDGYPDSLPVIADRLRTGGLLIVDNMIWHNRIFDESDKSRSTEGVREITRLLTTDPAWTSSLVPIRDGLILAQKR